MPQEPKKVHTKSRNSCGQCRKRRVKCDLQSPICSHCRRRNEPCDFLALTWQTPNFSQAPQPGASSEQNAPSSIPASIDTSTTLSHTSNALLNHYLSSTASTLHLLSNFSPFFQVQLPALAEQYLFLKHALLSISALHIAYLHANNPEHRERYEGLSRSHHHQSLSLFQTTIQDLDSQNGIAVFPFSILMAMYHFRMSCLGYMEDGGDHAQQEASKWRLMLTPLVAVRSALRLLQGGLKSFIDRSPFQKLEAELANQLLSEKLDEDLIFRLDQLSSRLPRPSHLPGFAPQSGNSNVQTNYERPSQAMPAPQPEDPTSPLVEVGLQPISPPPASPVSFPIDMATLGPHGSAVAILRFAFVQFGTKPKTWLHIAWWPYQISEEYFTLLENGDPLATDIFEVWKLFMGKAPNKWFWDGWVAAADGASPASSSSGSAHVSTSGL